MFGWWSSGRSQGCDGSGVIVVCPASSRLVGRNLGSPAGTRFASSLAPAGLRLWRAGTLPANVGRPFRPLRVSGSGIGLRVSAGFGRVAEPDFTRGRSSLNVHFRVTWWPEASGTAPTCVRSTEGNEPPAQQNHRSASSDCHDLVGFQHQDVLHLRKDTVTVRFKPGDRQTNHLYCVPVTDMGDHLHPPPFVDRQLWMGGRCVPSHASHTTGPRTHRCSPDDSHRCLLERLHPILRAYNRVRDRRFDRVMQP